MRKNGEVRSTVVSFGIDRGGRPHFRERKHMNPHEVSMQRRVSIAAGRQIKGYVKATTFHGVDQLLSANTLWGKLFWAVVIMFVLVMVVFQLHKLIVYFVLNPTLTSISLVYVEDGLEFPPITVCILLKINQTRLKERYPNMSNTLAEFVTASFMSAYSTALMDPTHFLKQNLSHEDLQGQLDAALNNNQLIHFVQDTTFDCEGQFLYCWFENGKIMDCCDPESDLQVKRFLIHSGPCFEFKYAGLKQRLPGPVGGFGFTYWYPNDHVLSTVFNSYDEHAIHLYTSPSEAMLEKNPIVLQVGTHSHISLESARMARLKEDRWGRSICENQQLKYFHKYSYPNCQAECLIDSMYDKCNCTSLNTFAMVNYSQVCTPLDSFHCFHSLHKKFSSILVKCRMEKCAEACFYWSYKASLTVGKIFNPNFDLGDLQKYWRLPETGGPGDSLIIADLYFNEIQYTEVQQLPALTISSFVSSIGGAMGLWTGASIITWIHLLYFWIGSCWRRSRDRENDEPENVLLNGGY